MRIIDQNGNEIRNPDFNYGYYIEETIIIAHHPAQPYIPEKWHYEVIAEYPNGGKEVEKIIDVPGQEAKDAWDEVENILRWYPYSEEEIEAKKKYPIIEDMSEALDILGVTE